MTIRPFLFAAVAIACFGCGPGSPTRSATDIAEVHPSVLAAIYRQSPSDRIYLNCRIACRLEANGYRILHDHIETHFITEGKPGCVAFFCDSLPADHSRPLTITGTCRGIVRDGILREPGVDYYVKVDGCSVIVTP